MEGDRQALDDTPPLEQLQLCISAAMAGRGNLVRDLRGLGATVKCGVVTKNTTHCLATPQELSQPTIECAQCAARTIPIVHESFAMACIRERQLVAWQDHQLVDKLPVDETDEPEGAAESEPARAAEGGTAAATTSNLSESEETQEATLLLPELSPEGALSDRSNDRSDESDAESEDMFAEDHCSPTPPRESDDDARASDTPDTVAASDADATPPAVSGTVPFDADDDDDSTEGEDEESAATDSSVLAQDRHIIDAASGVPSPETLGATTATVASLHDGPTYAMESPVAAAPSLPNGVNAGDVDACVKMGLDRQKSIGWLYAYRLEQAPLASALEWLLDKVDYEPPPILTRQQSVQKVHELMGGQLSTEVCEAELGQDNDIDECVSRLVQKLAKQTKAKQSKQRQQPSRATRYNSNHGANSSGHLQASSQEAAQAPAVRDRLRQKRRAEEIGGVAAEAPVGKRAKEVQAGDGGKDRIELHRATDEEEVMRRCAGAFEWIHRADQIQPSAEVAKQYPRIQRAWEQLTDADVLNMTRKRWLRTDTGPKLCDQPVYLGWLQSPDHPAWKNGNSRGRPDLEIGVFASETIEKGEEVLSYVGRPVSSKDSPTTATGRRSGEYSQLWQPANACYDIEIDAEHVRNLGPMVNDFRDDVQFPRRPNVSSRNANLTPRHKYWKVPASQGFPLIVFEAKRRIHRGEELLWDYSVSYWETRNHIEDEADEPQDVVMPSQRTSDDYGDEGSAKSQVF